MFKIENIDIWIAVLIIATIYIYPDLKKLKKCNTKTKNLTQKNTTDLKR